ncbi:M23 family metallopeptidase [Candidatus Gottesmanbacteria bacterium]|nr:M23 family metallopeptidase [Candidatus Gottesmanbacteria bacterium]
MSLILRKKIEAAKLPQTIGVYLSGVAVFSAVLVPTATDFVANLQVERVTEQTYVEVVPTDTKFQWPFTRFGLTTRFSAGHPGVDLINPIGVPIYPIANGWVQWSIFSNWGYGNHVLVEHDSGIKSLYGHMSKIDVKPGQTVDKKTKLGEVGSTGWSTGSHVHLEVYQNNIPINPLDVLPSIAIPPTAVAVSPQQSLPTPSPISQ